MNRADFCLNDVKFEVELLDLKNCFVVFKNIFMFLTFRNTKKSFVLLYFWFKCLYFYILLRLLTSTISFDAGADLVLAKWGLNLNSFDKLTMSGITKQ